MRERQEIPGARFRTYRIRVLNGSRTDLAEIGEDTLGHECQDGRQFIATSTSAQVLLGSEIGIHFEKKDRSQIKYRVGKAGKSVIISSSIQS